MRIIQDPDAESFGQWLLGIGHGLNVDSDDNIDIPSEMLLSTFSELTDFIYPGLSVFAPSPLYFKDRMILAPRNIDVNTANQSILEKMPGEEMVFHSADCLIDENEKPIQNDGGVPSEVLRSLVASNFPPGELHLKIGCPVILLRNLSPTIGLCNGTRLVIVRTLMRVLEAKITGGEHDGDVVFIPRISLHSQGSSGELPYKIRRRQFPVKLAFALSINKAQGQSVKWIGVDLRTPIFSHGQLYVALSRATRKANIRILTPNIGGDSGVTNVVYPEVLVPLNTLTQRYF